MYSTFAAFETQPLRSLSPAYLPVLKMYSFQLAPDQRHHQRPPRPVYTVDMFRSPNILPEPKPYGSAVLPQISSSPRRQHHQSPLQQPQPPPIPPSRGTSTITTAYTINGNSQRVRGKTRRSFADYLEHYAQREVQVCGRLSKPRRRERDMATFNCHPPSLPPPPPSVRLYWAQGPFRRNCAAGSDREGGDRRSSQRDERRRRTNDERD